MMFVESFSVAAICEPFSALARHKTSVCTAEIRRKYFIAPNAKRKIIVAVATVENYR
jgi:hypothetical protein